MLCTKPELFSEEQQAYVPMLAPSTTSNKRAPTKKKGGVSPEISQSPFNDSVLCGDCPTSSYLSLLMHATVGRQ